MSSSSSKKSAKKQDAEDVQSSEGEEVSIKDSKKRRTDEKPGKEAEQEEEEEKPAKGKRKKSKTEEDNTEEEVKKPSTEKRRSTMVPIVLAEAQKQDGDALTVYVSGFPFDSDINEIVRGRTDGVVDVRVHTWHDTGRSRGCAHIDYENPDHVKAALAKLHRFVVGSRYIEAVLANSKSSGAAPPEKEDDSRGGRKLFVKNIPYDMTEQEMKDVFAKFGTVKDVRIPKWNHTSNQKGFGYVEFEQKSFAVTCVKSHRERPIQIKGRSLVIDYDQGRPKRGFKDETGRAWYKPPKDSSETNRSRRKF